MSRAKSEKMKSN